MRTMFLLLLLSTTAFAEEPITVTIKVVDAEGRAVEAAEADFFWQIAGPNMKQHHLDGGLTDAKGMVTLRTDTWFIKRPLLILSKDRRQGLFHKIDATDNGKTLTLKLGPTAKVKGKYYCKTLNFAPIWMNVQVLPAKAEIPPIEQISKSATFDLILPIGNYTFKMYGEDVLDKKQEVELTTMQSEYGLGVIDFEPNTIAKLKGKPAPKMKITAARGVSKDVQFSDYKGKWVFVDFWAYWCGPCVANSLPRLMQLQELYKEHDDKFAILTIHNKDAKSLKEMDGKLVDIKKEYWNNQELSLPILLDGNGIMQKTFGIQYWPSGFLIDPNGIMVGMADEEEFAEKLPKLSADKVWNFERDLPGRFYNSTVPHPDRSFDFQAEVWTRNMFTEVAVDPKALAKLGLKPSDPLPAIVIGSSLTYRSLEALMFAPLGLGIVPAADNKSLLITTKKPIDEEPTAAVKAEMKVLRDKLDGNGFDAKLEPLTLDSKPLTDALRQIANHFDIVLSVDSLAIHNKIIDPQTKLSGTLDPKHLRRDLNKMFKPLGLQLTVKHEAIVLTP